MDRPLAVCDDLDTTGFRSTIGFNHVTLLRLVDVTRRFSGVVALDRVSLDIEAGEVHALVGENGAGKSTLINLLSGVLTPDAGSIVYHGEPIALRDPVAARRLGIFTVHQEVDVFPTLSLAENLAHALGLPRRWMGLVDWNAVEASARRAVQSLREPIDVRITAERLSIAQRQMARIASAIEEHARVLLLDEPTSSLSESETRWLFEHLAVSKACGTAIIYISHRHNEIFELADRITVLRDGRRVWSGPTSEIDSPRLIEAMVGREAPNHVATRGASRQFGSTAPRLQITGLTDRGGAFTDIGFQVQPGEIVGIYGLVGAGRSELAQAIFGLRSIRGGTVHVDGRRLPSRDSAAAVAAGVGFAPEDRLSEGIFRELSVRVNATIASLDHLGRGPFVSLWRERAAVTEQVTALGVKCRSPEQPIRQLSGGNQQKTMLARWLLTRPRVLLLDEPTRGVDVVAKADIHRLLRDWVDTGQAAVVISSDLPEVMSHADRVLVLRAGRIAGEFDPRTASPADVARAALPIETEQLAADHAEARARRRGFPSEWGVALATMGLALALTATNSNFLTPANLLGVFTNTAVWTILALGAAGVIIAGAIDISIGAIMAVAAACCALVLKSSLPAPVSIPLGIATGLLVGGLLGANNALIAIVGRVHPIVVTLASMTALRGILIMITGGDAITSLPPRFDQLANARWLGINGSIVTMLLVVAAVHVWLRHTVAGRHAYAWGSNPAAARMVGISKRRVWPMVFGVGGLLAAAAGMLELAQSGAMQSSMGTGYELRAIAAAVIGGTAITGGRGTAIGVWFGALLISLVNNALVLWQVSRYHSEVVVGGLILVAVLWDLAWRKLERSRVVSTAGV